MKRQIAAFVMLAVFLPILLLSSIHVHESAESAEVTCVDCLHNHCGGHLTQTTVHMDDCVLCQFLTLTFVATAAVSLIYINKVVSSRIDVQRRNVCVAYSGIVGLRAPPAVSI